MRAIVLAGLALLVASAPANAVEARFQGGFNVIAQSGSCPFYNPVGDNGIARFREPVKGTTNPGFSTLMLHGSRNIKGYRKDGKFTGTFRDVDTIYTGDGWGPDDSADPQKPRLKVEKVVREPPSGNTKKTTEFIGMVVKINGYDFMPNCTVTIRVALFQVVNFS